MKPKLLRRGILLLLVCILSVFAVIPIPYSGTDRTDWMAQLDDSTALNRLSIPGTHDSGALHSLADISGKCQTLSIREQLKIGVRFFDLRLQLVDNKLRIVHSIVDQMTTLADVLSEMRLFLREHPGEFLLVSIKEDAAPKRSDADFTAALEQMLLSCEAVCTDRTLPETVGDARGGLYVLARYRDASIGIPCYDGWADDAAFALDTLYIQDNYRVRTSGEKLYDITQTFTEAEKQDYALVLNYASCYLTSGFPPLYAGLPAREINVWLLQLLSLPIKTPGGLICDFITAELADSIIGRNFS